MIVLDKHSPIPLYYQLAELIKEQIRSGELKPGAQLPAERTLSEQHAISRMTARQAISYLTREGTLIARHGLGTFVAEPKLTHDALHLLGFTEEIMQRGGKAISQVLEQALALPPLRVASELQLAPGEQVVKIVRLRLSDTMPLLLETTYIPASICPALTDEDLSIQSLYALLERRCGVRLKRARQTLEATVANEYESGLFGVAPGMAMILLEGVTYDERDRPTEYFKAIYRGDRFKFTFESERSVWVYDAPGMPRVSILLADSSEP
ncbi:MAG TPA: GntR family transcriptional regulator [Roseiflexaceae bacterium]|nr:GntR family transcriptional regulator [Roseiflexaceae bacterium]